VPQARRGRVAVHHGYVTGEEDTRMDLLNYFHRIDNGLQPLLRDEMGCPRSEHPRGSVARRSGTGEDDLLDLAAVQTLLRGGTVYTVAAEDVPDDARAAALLRY
jgi:hypothetical protein